MDDNIKGVIAAQDVLAQETFIFSKRNFSFQNSGPIFVLRPDKNNTIFRQGRITRNDDPFYNLVRICMDQHTIFKSTGFHFIGIANNIAWKGCILGYRHQLHTGRKRSPTPAE